VPVIFGPRIGLAALRVDRGKDKDIRIIYTVHPAWPVMIGLGGATLLGVIASPSPLVVLASGIVAILIVGLLWRPGHPPLLLVPVLLQFLQVALKPAMTAYFGRPLWDLSDFDLDLEPAALFGLAAIGVLALGLRIGAGRSLSLASDEDADDWPLRRVLALSLALIMIGHALDAIAGMLVGARQIILALSGMKSAGLFALAYGTLRLRQGSSWLIAVVLSEIIVGMTGFFADFRLVLFVLAGAAVAAHGRVSVRATIWGSLVAALTLALAVFWTSGKQEYRDFLNEGTGEQVVLRSLDRRIDYLVEKVIEFDGQKFADGLKVLVQRISYIDFLAATMDWVPRVIPYEGGTRLGQAVWHVLTPRIIFPDKPDVPNDTQATAYYTALPGASFANENTSISIGYLGELYVDFGVGGALLVVALMGVIFGRYSRAIRDYPRTPAFINYALCMMFVLTLSSFETALLKLIGSSLIVAAAVLLLQRIVWPFLFQRNVRVSGRRNFSRSSKA
jgi:hypothetical protein